MDIKAFRTRRGLTQKAFAESIGITQPGLSRYETKSRKVPDRVITEIWEKYGSILDRDDLCEDTADTMTPAEIRALRTRLFLTQAAFAESIGITQTNVSKYETGVKRPSDKVVMKIREKYGSILENMNSCEDTVEAADTVDVKTIRIELGLTQRAFAESVGITQTSVSLYETGKKRPSNRVIIKIRERYGEEILHTQE